MRKLNERGAVAAEFALLLPVLLTILFGIIEFGMIMYGREVVTNATRDFSRALLDVGVTYREDTDRCLMILREVGSALEKDPLFARRIIGSFEYPGVQALGESAVLLRMVAKTHPHDGPIVQRELRRRVKKAFDEAGIEIPYPHLKVLTDK